MIVCTCAGISEKRVRAAIQDGARSLEEIARQLRGAGADCGSCRVILKHLMGQVGVQNYLAAQIIDRAQ
ncbi:MAG: (2Fe-2S)-binding protein [Myxococcota bacterium]